VLRSTSLLALLAVGFGGGCTLEPDPNGSAFGSDSETGDDGDSDFATDSASGTETSTTETSTTTGNDTDDENETGNNHDGGECAGADLEVQPIAPTVILLLDQSGSMDDDFGDLSRWDTMVNSLTNSDTGVVPGNEDKVNFGLALYHGAANDGDVCPQLNTVDAGPFAAVSITDYLTNSEPQQQTPTGESLQAVAEQLAADTSIEGEKIIILATDGQPDTCADPSGHDDVAKGVVLDAATTAFANDIQTRIISVGPDTSAEHLQDVANAGFGLEVGGSENAEYYEALNADALFSAFDEIINSATSCSFAVEGEIPMDDICSGEVVMDGELLNCGDDWTIEGDSTLKLLGDACEGLRDGENHTVEASWTCEVYIP
jgi:hypothetical protein